MSTLSISKTHTDVLILQALAQVDGLGSKTLWLLLNDAGSPTVLWEVSEDFLKARLSEAKVRVFLRRREEGFKSEDLERCEAQGIQVIPCTDALYSPLLKEIHNPPLLLYVQGNLEALSGKTLAVVGTRNASEYGRQVTEKLIHDLQPAGVTIVSGLAAGIDTIAHWAALNEHLPTVAVFGCGLDVIFPRTNQRLSEEIVAQGGALVSEYPPGTPGSKYTYPQRNRIVAGLSHGVLVAEGDVRSGALITARLALEEGRTVFAVPGNIFSPGSQGPLYLIKNGAAPVASAEDLLRDLNWWLEPQQLSLGVQPGTETVPVASEMDNLSANLSEPEAQLLKSIPFDPVSVDSLPQACGLPSAGVNELLTLLELEGLIVLLPGAKVCRK
ncbi:MAG TPA: DNA-processing protein DprA [Coleofasciculaceae cyanobacterium]|jgi:DNA processing protein